MKKLLKGTFIVLYVVLSTQCKETKTQDYHYRYTLPDWPQLNYYVKANSALPPPAQNEDRVVFMGNSITQSWKTIRPEFFEGKPYVNRAISGQTTPQMLVRFRQDVLALQPQVVAIMAGTNDIAENTGPTTVNRVANNLKSMCEIARANNVKVILCTVLPAEDYPWQRGKDPKNKIPALNQILSTYAQANEVYYLDYFSALSNGRNGMDEIYSDDGVHLTIEGYKVLEPMIENAIEELLAQE